MISEAQSIQNFLQQELDRRIRTNPRYSLRAFARTLGLSSGALSEILRARRSVSLKTATLIADSLGLNVIERKLLYELTNSERRKSLIERFGSVKNEKSLQEKQLDEDTFQLVSGWQHFAIINLLDCEGFRWSASYIASCLGLTASQAQLAMNLLVRLGLVVQKNERFRGVKEVILAPDGVTSKAIRNYHRQILEKVVEALEVQNVAQRDIRGLGFAVDPKNIESIKADILEFQDSLSRKYSKGKKTEVYFLETALFRITHRGTNEKS